MSEYIEREQCIRTVCEACNMQYGDEPCEPSDCFIRERLMEMPAAEVEPVRPGQWRRTGRILDGFIEVQCSECEETHLFDMIRLETAARYCPYCGVKWDGGADNGE